LLGNQEPPSQPSEISKLNDSFEYPTGQKRIESVDSVFGLVVFRKLDPGNLLDSPWCRTETLDQQELEELMSDIRLTGTNEIPVLVHAKADGKLEVIYGARRVQACRQLTIAVSAHCIDHELDAETVFRLQVVENRSRSIVSAYENSLLYQKALAIGLYSNQSTLAKAIGKSQPWISTVLPMANLPLNVVHAFDYLSELQPAHASEIFTALKSDPLGVVLRAKQFIEMRNAKKRRSAKETMRFLIGRDEPANDAWNPLSHDGKEVGSWKFTDKDGMTVRIPRKLALEEITALAKLANGVSQTVDSNHKLLINLEKSDITSGEKGNSSSEQLQRTRKDGDVHKDGVLNALTSN
jgi:ParB/RepB/Spo0J family partition protein